jgi:hypothetical protein
MCRLLNSAVPQEFFRRLLGSRRRAPIHSSLIQLGLLDYVDRIKQAGHVRLFPALTKGDSGDADPVEKWFGRVVTKLGILDEAVAPDSLGHDGISKLSWAGCPHNVCEMLAGITQVRCMVKCMSAGKASR